MKIKLLSAILIASAVAILMSSCATTYPNEKMLYGTWVAVKASPTADFQIPDSLLKKPESMPKDTGQVVNKGKKEGKGKADTRTPEEIAQHKAMKLRQLIAAEQRSKIVIRPDKTADKIYPGKTYTGKWKLKDEGNVLVGRNKEKGKFVFDIQSLNDSTMIVVEHLEYIDLVVKYIKK